MKVTGGMTILSSARGKWTHEGVEYPEKVIPVRVMVEETPCEGTKDGREHGQINEIIFFTIHHYRQKAVMFYEVSNKVHIVYSNA